MSSNMSSCHSNEKHEQHEAKIHLLTAFGGCRNNETKARFLKHCIEKSCVESCWIHSSIRYSTLEEMITAHYESWINHFPKSGQIERYAKFEDMGSLKKVWMNIRLPLIEKLFKNTNVPAGCFFFCKFSKIFHFQFYKYKTFKIN